MSQQRQITQLTTERDTILEQLGRVEELAGSLQRAATGGSMRDTLRELSLRAKEAEYYRRHYEDAMPREHRVQSFTASRSSRSRETGSRTESRGVTGPIRQDPLGDPGAGTSTERPSPLGDCHT